MWTKVLVVLPLIFVCAASVRHCRTEDADILSNIFVNCLPGMDGSYCPADGWLPLFNAADVESGNKQHYNFVNIGFNKGYNFATWMNVFAEHWDVDTAKWYQSLKSSRGRGVGILDQHICGTCSDCRVPPFRSEYRNRQIDRSFRIVGVELNKANIDAVELALANIRTTYDIPKELLQVDLIFGAAGAPELATGAATIKVPKCSPGFERCKIPSSKNDHTASDYSVHHGLVEIPVISVDKLAKELDLVSGRASMLRLLNQTSKAQATTLPGATVPSSRKHNRLNSNNNSTSTEDMIDILQIDTEGNDAEVIKSAKRLIQGHRVRALIFEYHSYQPWANTMLKDVLPTITAHHMVCYFMGQNRLWPISHTCWHDRYEVHNWSNIMCVLKPDVWYKAIQPLVVNMDDMRKQQTDSTALDAFREQQFALIRDNKTLIAQRCDRLVRGELSKK